MRKYNDGEVRACLKLHIARNYDLKGDFARKYKLSKSYLSQLLSGASPIPDKVLKAIGFQRKKAETYFVRAKK